MLWKYAKHPSNKHNLGLSELRACIGAKHQGCLANNRRSEAPEVAAPTRLAAPTSATCTLDTVLPMTCCTLTKRACHSCAESTRP
jgi:hypothetical protein